MQKPMLTMPKLNIKDLLIFLLLNFGALAIGGLLMGEGPSGEYYTDLNKAPWTPPGWVFGAAWFTIMVCFSVYMAYWKSSAQNSGLWILFGIQWVLNVLWNPLFFMWHFTGTALIVIATLTTLIGYILYRNREILGVINVLIAPYFIWLCIATTLNWYIIAYN